MDITTSVGCPIKCKFCPQDKFIRSYLKRSNETVMSMETFQNCLNKIPKTNKINFSGFCEPFLNRDCVNMIKCAAEKGYNIGVFTTLYGITSNDIDRISKFNIKPFDVHLPDYNGNTKININEEYLDTLDRVITTMPKENQQFNVHDKGARMDPKIKPLIDKYNVPVGSCWIHSRAGNVYLPHSYHYGSLFCVNSGYDLNNNVLFPNGDVALCCMDFSLQHILGNLLNQEYNELFNNMYRKVLGAMKSNREECLCRKCEYARRKNV